METLGAVLAGLLANLFVAAVVGFVAEVVADGVGAWAAAAGRGPGLYLVLPNEAAVAPALGGLVALVLLGVVPAVAGAFAGGAVAAAREGVRPGLVAVLSCLPLVAVLLMLGEYGPGGEGVAAVAAVASLPAAGLGAVVARRGWTGIRR